MRAGAQRGHGPPEVRAAPLRALRPAPLAEYGGGMVWIPPKPFAWNHCGTCGAPLESAHDGERERPWCRDCNRFYYRNPVPACCVLVEDGAGGLLFVQRAVEPALGRWSLPGGFMEAGERAEECVARELEEETGLITESCRILGTGAGHNALSGHVLVLGFLVERWRGTPRAGSDALDLAFVKRDARPEVPFTAHRELLALYDTLVGASRPD